MSKRSCLYFLPILRLAYTKTLLWLRWRASLKHTRLGDVMTARSIFNSTYAVLHHHFLIGNWNFRCRDCLVWTREETSVHFCLTRCERAFKSEKAKDVIISECHSKVIDFNIGDSFRESTSNSARYLSVLINTEPKLEQAQLIHHFWLLIIIFKG